MPTPDPTPSALSAILASRWLRPLNDPVAIDDLLSRLRPSWSLSRIRARVVAATTEAEGVRTLLLAPNRLWPGHVAGQHVCVEVEIRGRRLVRTFSLSSPPRPDGLVAITVKRREGGKVSRWWNESAAVGDVVTLGRPGGDFTLPSPLPPRLVMLSAGSGITPLMAMLRDLDSRASACDVEFVHWASSRDSVIFRHELDAIASRRPWLRLDLHFSGESGRPGAAVFAALAAGSGHAPVFACGPQGFLDSARRAWREARCESEFHSESFGFVAKPIDQAAAAEAVHATRSNATFAASRGQSLLEAAEAAGLRPAHGCRIGVCHTCKCRLLSGSVEDLRDGRVVSEPGQMIQLCVSSPRTALSLEL